MNSPKVLFLVPYPVKHAPSQRFRVELFEPTMQATDVQYTIAPFMDEATWKMLYKQGNTVKKAWGIIKGYLKRLKTVLLDVHQYDYVFVHREAAPLGPPIFEWMVSKVWRKKMIFDFDDAIWLPNTTKENKLAAALKAVWKIPKICKWSYKVVGGNDYLCNYAKQYNDQVIKIPTCVDMQRGHRKIKEHTEGKVTIGWTGSHSTLPYLNDIVPVIQKLEKKYDIEFLVIANKEPDFDINRLKFLPWNEHTEVDDLLKMDIGIMPLKKDKWSEGKCGFKLIQYLSLGIPAVASPVGVNSVIIDQRENGYLCDDAHDWEQALAELIESKILRVTMGKNGHKKMLAQYSVQSQEQKFIQLFT